MSAFLWAVGALAWGYLCFIAGRVSKAMAMREAWEAHAEMDRSLSIAWGKKVLEADAEVARLRGALEYIEGATRPVGVALYPSWLHKYARAALAPQKEEENPDAE